MPKHMNRRGFLKSMAVATITPYFLGQATPAISLVLDGEGREDLVRLKTFDYNGVRLLDGMLKKQYEATRGFYFNIPNDDMLLGFRKRAGLPAPGTELGGWYSHDIGNNLPQWLSGMARMYKATGDRPILEKATYLMREWAKAMDPDGYFYYSRKPFPVTYTYDKTVCSLVDLYHYAGQKEALGHLEKITDWAIKNVVRTNPNPSAEHPDAGSGPPTTEANRLAPLEWYTLSENLYRAYQVTGNSKYKAFGDVWRYPNYWGMFTRDSEPTPFGFHAYSHCNTLSSAAMTYAVTGDPEYLKVIVNAYDWFDRTQFYATGGYGPNEALQRPDGSLGKSLETTTATFETPCGSWAGFKLAKYLMRFTSEARYGDWIERLVYNCIGATLPLSNLSRRGRTFYYSSYKIGGARKVYAGDTFPCCCGTYSQAVADYHDLIYFHDPDSLYVNLFVPSRVSWNHQGSDIEVEQETNYPESETTTLHVNATKGTAFALKFRVPQWCVGMSFEVNGSRQEITARPGTWASINRRWKSGDVVKVAIPMPPRFVPIDKQHPNRVALVVGPVVLVRENESPAVPMQRDLAKITRPGGSFEYHVEAQPDRPLVPFYQVGEGALYGMYFDVEND